MLLGLLERLHRNPPAGVAFILFVQRFDVAYAAFSQHFYAQFFSQIKIIVIERIFGAVAAAHHAAAAADAGRTRGALACEIRVALLLRLRMFVIRTEIHRHAGAVKAAAHARFIGQFFQHMVGIGQQRIGGYAEHFFRRAVMLGHFSRPIAQERPSAAAPHFFRRHEQGVGINHRAAAHRIAVQHQHMPKQPQRKKAAAKKRGQPQKTAQIAGAFRHIARRKPAPLLHHQHTVAFLRQPQSRHAAAEAGADNQIIGVKRSHIRLYFLVFTRFQTA